MFLRILFQIFKEMDTVHFQSKPLPQWWHPLTNWFALEISQPKGLFVTARDTSCQKSNQSIATIIKKTEKHPTNLTTYVENESPLSDFAIYSSRNQNRWTKWGGKKKEGNMRVLKIFWFSWNMEGKWLFLAFGCVGRITYHHAVIFFCLLTDLLL